MPPRRPHQAAEGPGSSCRDPLAAVSAWKEMHTFVDPPSHRGQKTGSGQSERSGPSHRRWGTDCRAAWPVSLPHPMPSSGGCEHVLPGPFQVQVCQDLEHVADSWMRETLPRSGSLCIQAGGRMDRQALGGEKPGRPGCPHMADWLCLTPPQLSPRLCPVAGEQVRAPQGEASPGPVGTPPPPGTCRPPFVLRVRVWPDGLLFIYFLSFVFLGHTRGIWRFPG